jgi:acyl-CoA thioester hydrolase
VYYANYMKFIERARTDSDRWVEIFEARFNHNPIMSEIDHGLHENIRKPASYDEQLQVTCAVRETTRASITLDQEVYRETVGGELLLDGRVRAACLDALKYRPRPLPPELWEQINAGDR